VKDSNSKQDSYTDGKQSKDSDTLNRQENYINSTGTPRQISKSGQKPGASELRISMKLCLPID
jgi:regulatory protein YycH of two-component signal transduction system YycFG